VSAEYVRSVPLAEHEKMESWRSGTTTSSANTADGVVGVTSSRSAVPGTGTATSTAAPTCPPVNVARPWPRSVTAGRSTTALIDGDDER